MTTGAATQAFLSPGSRQGRESPPASMCCSDAFELIEGLAAGLATPQGFAGGRSEFRDALDLLGAATGAAQRLLAEQRAARGRMSGGRNAVFQQFRAPLIAHPIRGPGW